MSEHPTFTGFPRPGLDLLTELGHRDKAWLDANRATYDDAVAAPAKAFVDALGERLRTEVSPDLVAIAKVNGSISPINNDVRFAPGAAPYKDHLLFRFWEGAAKQTAPTLFVRVSAATVGFATGCTLADLDQWRAAVADETTGPALVGALSSLGRRRDLEVVGQALKRVPPPFGAEHPRADLLRHKGFQARWAEPTPASITRASFVDWCARRLVACADVHRWLVDELT